MNEWMISTAIGIATGIAGWLVGRRKEKANVQGLEYENFERFVAANGKMIAAMKEEIGAQLDIIRELRDKTRLQDQELEDLRGEVRKLKEQFPCSECPRSL
jgi:hypothetical protein